MGFLSTFLDILGFTIGSAVGIAIGFFFFIYSDDPKDAEDPPSKRLNDLEIEQVQELMPEIPYWVKSPDYDRVEWLNKFIFDLWPFLEKEIDSTIRSVAQPIFADYIGQFGIESIEFEKISIGSLPPIIHGLKVCETNENELMMEPAIKWAGNPNITVSVKLKSLRIIIQVVEIQVYATPRITLKPLVPTFPCFSKAVVSLMEKPHVDFGLKVLGGDIMSIPVLRRYIQETIKKQVASLYLWPQSLEIPILDPSIMVTNKPVGVLHVKVVRALELLKMDFLGKSDPYVKLHLSGDGMPARKTTIKKRNLNPEWNESFKLIVKNPQSQFLLINVMDWDKVGAHDKLGTQVFPLRVLSPNETKEVTLDLLKSTSITRESPNQKRRGQIVLELRYAPFSEGLHLGDGSLDRSFHIPNQIDRTFSKLDGAAVAGLLMVSVYGAEDVEGSHHNNPYVQILFKGEKRKSKVIKRSRDPLWNEEFQFVLEEPPISDRIHIQVLSKRTLIGFRSKESLGHVEVNLDDVVHNGRINEKYHLIDSKNGRIHIELRWKTI